MNDIDPRLNEQMKEDPKPAPIPEIAPEPEPSAKILLWAVGIIAVLLIAIFAIRAVYTPDNRELETYNNFEFEKRAGLWVTEWQVGEQLFIPGFHYLPQETLNITPAVRPTWNETQFNSRDEIFVVFEPSDDLLSPYIQVAASEIAFKMRAIGYNISAGYSTNATGDYPVRPVVNCNTPNTSVILIYDINDTAGIQYEQSCITIFGHREELVRATDRFLYRTYGIIP